jgi:signal transduction histidine kinase
VEPSMKACTAWVSASLGEGRLLLEVEDDGMGCDPATINEKRRIGIGNVRERLALLYSSAFLELRGSPGEGFRARIVIPLAELEVS